MVGYWGWQAAAGSPVRPRPPLAEIAVAASRSKAALGERSMLRRVLDVDRRATAISLHSETGALLLFDLEVAFSTHRPCVSPRCTGCVSRLASTYLESSFALAIVEVCESRSCNRILKPQDNTGWCSLESKIIAAQ